MSSTQLKFPTVEYEQIARVIAATLAPKPMMLVDLLKQLRQQGYNNGDQISYVIDYMINQGCYVYDPQTDNLLPGTVVCQV